MKPIFVIYRFVIYICIGIVILGMVKNNDSHGIEYFLGQIMGSITVMYIIYKLWWGE